MPTPVRTTGPTVSPLPLARPDGLTVGSVAAWRAAGELGSGHLHPAEAARLTGMRDRRRREFLLGRYLAKLAVAGLTGERDLAALWLDAGVFGQPVLRAAGISGVQVSLAHAYPVAVAVAAGEETPLGVDVEQVGERVRTAVEPHLTGRERALLDEPAEVAATRLWAAKEALGKALRTGVTVPLPVFEVGSAADGRLTFTRFPQYAAHTELVGRTCLALVLPARSEPGPEWAATVAAVADD